MIPGRLRRIARERIRILLREAEKNFPRHKERSNRYIELARRIGMKYKVRLPKKYKRRICPYCYSYIRPGVNCVVRLRPKERCVVWHCMECGKDKRYPYRKKKTS